MSATAKTGNTARAKTMRTVMGCSPHLPGGGIIILIGADRNSNRAICCVHSRRGVVCRQVPISRCSVFVLPRLLLSQRGLARTLSPSFQASRADGERQRSQSRNRRHPLSSSSARPERRSAPPRWNPCCGTLHNQRRLRLRYNVATGYSRHEVRHTAAD
jgi:hypothetical protein